MIRRRDPGHFGWSFLTEIFIKLMPNLFEDAVKGPVILSIALFVAVFANFVIRGLLLPLFENILTGYCVLTSSSRTVSALHLYSLLIDLRSFPDKKGGFPFQDPTSSRTLFKSFRPT